ncbi:response regulator [Emticicia sp. CRIBPO]|uniref:response regulator transcription factor n=1 Tax=Emticicia sp. CRIBPO TaxID=2683258 RepID=UPI001411EC51|nr:response regulator transcription factor [Emticicia sp. CRIBPO]NBA88917.1 response regulator [Emticicia sp. CRIBPO]
MSRIRLLYVEDEVFLGKIVKESLESRDFEICMVSDGREVMPAFRKFQPDVCVLDVMLPYKDGFELAREIRAIDQQMPILFLTAKTQTEDVLKGFESGGNDYLRKPFSMEELIVRIHNLRQLVGGKAGQAPLMSEAYDLGQYRFLPQQQELHFGETIRKLSYREAELLKILSENLNFKVLRKDILLKVWGDDSFFNSRNLDVYITRLREYFRQDPGVEIMTLKGVGYLFKVVK